MIAQEIVKMYDESKEILKNILESRDKEMEGLRNLNSVKQDEIYKEERRISDKKYKIEREFKDAATKLDEDVSLACVPLHKTASDIGHLIKLLELSTNLAPIEWGAAKTYRDRELIMSDIIHSDTYLKMRYVIVRNDKPVNKYDICLIGNCLFDEELIKLPYTYGVDIDTTGMNIRTFIKSVKTVKDAEKYIAKNQNKYQEIISTVSDLANEMEEAMEKYTLDDFSEIIEYICTSCWKPFKSPMPHTIERWTYSNGERKLVEESCECSRYSVKLL